MSTDGLNSAEAARRLIEFGENRIASGSAISPLRILIRQFNSPLVLLLAIASLLAAFLGELIDAAAIMAIVALNGCLGFVQEWRAERAIEALRDMLAPMAEVIRDGSPTMVPATELVPGDLVVLSEGQKVPADIELVAAHGLRLDESALTGESVPVDRDVGDETGVIFMGTLIVGGRGEGIVRFTGTSTRFGEIAELTTSAGEKTTRLQTQMTKLSRALGVGGLAVAAVVLILGLLSGRALLDMVLIAVSMAVAVVPEGLPLVVTLTLAIGASAMVRHNALLRRLQAAETLGAASVICTDKTGTLTENKMTAKLVVTADATYEVTGTGYDPAGLIQKDGESVRAEQDADLWRLLHAGLVCNDAVLKKEVDWIMIGDPTEGALTTLAYKAWVPLPAPDSRLAETPFSSERKRMGTVALRPSGGIALFVKGAPEMVIDVCTHMREGTQDVPLDRARRDMLHAQQDQMARQGLRVIAIADRDAAGPHDTDERDLVLLGFVGLLDPPRPEVRNAVQQCQAAGIRVVMITGDSGATAGAIADLVGIKYARTLVGAELAEMSDADLSDALEDGVLFARTEPVHKMRIVEHMQNQGDIVAMTGDGVNDAPALRKANIGMAMGERGTEVAREAADLVILDDNFATIVSAIAEGRRQFANIRKFVRYLLSSNSAEMIALTVNLIIGGPIIFLPIHLLWINLLTDSVSAVALGLEPGEKEQMEHPPLRPDERVLTSEGVLALATFGLYAATVSLAVFYFFLEQGEELARTMAFTTLVVCQEIVVFAFRSDVRSAFSLGFRSNTWLMIAVAGMLTLQVLALYWPPLSAILGTVPLNLEQLGIVGLLASPVVVVPTFFKALRKSRQSPSTS